MREESDLEWTLPREILDNILEHFIGGIKSLCHWHLTEKYYHRKWRDSQYQAKLIEQQKERCLTVYLSGKCASYCGHFFDYSDLGQAFCIINYLLSNMPTKEVLTQPNVRRSIRFWFSEKIGKFLPSMGGTIETGTKTYPEKSSRLTEEQVYTMKVVQHYMKAMYGWILGIRRDGCHCEIEGKNFSKVYLEHEMTVSLPNK